MIKAFVHFKKKLSVSDIEETQVKVNCLRYSKIRFYAFACFVGLNIVRYTYAEFLNAFV